MAEDLELQNQIAALAGRINRHKTAESQPAYHAAVPQYPYGHHSGWTPYRGTPYGAPRGRGRGARALPHRNRTLVLNSGTTTPGSTGSYESPSLPAQPPADMSPAGWVSKRDRHMTLINNSIYEKTTQERIEAMETTRKKKTAVQEEREKAKVNTHFQILQTQAAHQPRDLAVPHHIYVQDIRFLVADGGSKLIKAPDEANLVKVTPKRAEIGGVTFFRSKRGNLYRAGLVKSKRNRDESTKLTQPCPQFSITGSCSKGPLCRYQHDVTKVAICRDFLLTGKCAAGEDCDLSHDPTPERVPACLHFVRGNCTNPACRYAHVRTNPGAPVCRAFATLGYCSRGASCPERHIHECPDYANKGICHRKNCRLPHVDRAGQLRKAAARGVASTTEDETSDVSSDEELDNMDSDDFDSDGMEEVFIPSSHLHKHELSQQMDFVQF